VKSDTPSTSEINLIAFDVRDGKASPENAKRLLSEFCRLAEADQPIPRRLVRPHSDWASRKGVARELMSKSELRWLERF